MPAEPIVGNWFWARASGTWSVPCSCIQRCWGSSILMPPTAHGYRTKMSTWNDGVLLTESQQHIINPTNPGCALNDGIEHRLHVRGRPADNRKHLSRCRLVLQSFPQFCVALLNLLEQSDVLDSDHGL